MIDLLPAGFFYQINNQEQKMNQALKTEIESYLNLENKLNKKIEQYQLSVELDSQDQPKLLNAVDYLEEQLRNCFELAIKHFKLKTDELINLINQTSEKAA